MVRSKPKSLRKHGFKIHIKPYALNGHLLNIYPTAKHTFFSHEHETQPRKDNMTDHKTSLSKFGRSEIISSIFFNHNTRILEFDKSKAGNLQACRN